MKLDVASVMDECAARMGAWGDYPDALFERAYGWPNPSVSPPAFVVGFPPSLDFNGAYDRGVDRIPDLPVWTVMGLPDTRVARDLVTANIDAVKARLEDKASPWESRAWASARVKNVSFETVANDDGTEYITARYTVDIVS